jgi:hypothetical protein
MQTLRYQLRRKVQRVESVRLQTYPVALGELLSFLDLQPACVCLLDPILTSRPDAKRQAIEIVDGRLRLDPATGVDAVALGYWVIQRCCRGKGGAGVMNVLRAYAAERTFDERLPTFTRTFVLPISRYVDERFADRTRILASLTAFRHDAETERRGALRSVWETGGPNGEAALARELARHLDEHGIRMVLREGAATGELSLEADERDEDAPMAEVRVFDPDNGRDLHSIRDACCDLRADMTRAGRSVCFLVLFNVSGEVLRVTLYDSDSGVPLVVRERKTLYVVTVDLGPGSDDPALGGSRHVIRVTEHGLFADAPG